MDKQTDRIKKRYDKTARFYNLTEKMMEMGGKMSLWRKELWQQKNIGGWSGNRQEY